MQSLYGDIIDIRFFLLISGSERVFGQSNQELIENQKARHSGARERKGEEAARETQLGDEIDEAQTEQSEWVKDNILYTKNIDIFLREKFKSDAKRNNWLLYRIKEREDQF